ncbi:hypothetical protein ACTTAM_06615 [Rhodobacter capsulatus]|uniref:hypothetical protein n=1 Tax=Rhodobacter capsulatus TaxID=1061 RepID=UPI0040256C63
MDHTDSFIDEVTEEVRRDRLFAAFRKYGWIGVVAILGLVGGSAYVEWSKTQRAARAEAFGDGILSALEAENPSEALAALPVAGPQGGMRKLLTAAQAAEDGKVDLALADLRAVAGDATLPDSLRQPGPAQRRFWSRARRWAREARGRAGGAGRTRGAVPADGDGAAGAGGAGRGRQGWRHREGARDHGRGWRDLGLATARDRVDCGAGGRSGCEMMRRCRGKDMKAGGLR